MNLAEWISRSHAAGPSQALLMAQGTCMAIDFSLEKLSGFGDLLQHCTGLVRLEATGNDLTSLAGRPQHASAEFSALCCVLHLTLFVLSRPVWSCRRLHHNCTCAVLYLPSATQHRVAMPCPAPASLLPCLCPASALPCLCPALPLPCPTFVLT